MSTPKDKKKAKDTTQKKGKTQNSTRPKSGVNKKTSEPTQSNGQGDNEFLRDLLSSYSDEPADNDFVCDLNSSVIEKKETNAEKCLNTVGDIKEKNGLLEEDLKEQLSNITMTNKEKDSQIDKLNETVIYLSKELAESKRAKPELENKIKLLEGTNTKLKSRLKTSEKELKELKQTFQSKEQKLNDEIKGLKEKNETLESCVKQIKDQKKNSEISPDQRVKELQDENTVLRDSLFYPMQSQSAGSKMTDGNPAIADLGDPNRPTQLGEKFSELYDNEWIDAMEELEGSGDEKTNITTIRNIIEKAYEFGKTRAGTFMKELEKSLLSLSNSIKVTPAISKLMKELRKGIATMVTEGIYQAFIDSHTEFKVGGDHLKSFIRKAVGLSWLMAIQDPPVVMSMKASGKFDSDRFRHYTKSGGSVDYVVWPVVYLHEGGPIICKGVAQGK